MHRIKTNLISFHTSCSKTNYLIGMTYFNENVWTEEGLPTSASIICIFNRYFKLLIHPKWEYLTSSNENIF